MFSPIKDIKHIFLSPDSCPRGWTLEFQKKKSVHGHVAYQIKGDDEYNTIQLNFYTRVKLVTLGLRSKAWGYAIARHRL